MVILFSLTLSFGTNLLAAESSINRQILLARRMASRIADLNITQKAAALYNTPIDYTSANANIDLSEMDHRQIEIHLKEQFSDEDVKKVMDGIDELNQRR